ncbi:hypothetical protein G6F70_006051 [Rhizopus microsporus]|nr:hypothetical protein G6F71_008992 [Rhizopus microsporus]KAG1198128.1 hypothetical protein G6F70_006051 [Rhizopus microsporus]KAG1209847.1 hypothetical protein G6F69_005986 [Rhizopus microsporus]KAG1231477.1 hypothetical protein G6F67_005715 [Rhizopus microsporus]KAG1257937.1 hypothetical protein G6F68_009054 [Rhizopus microsporus]
MPIFRCHGCEKTFKARNMVYIVQSLVSSNSLPTENSSTIDQAHDMQPLLEMIRRFSTELATARAEIANLHQQVTQLQELATQQSMNMNQLTHHENDNHLSSEDFPALSSQISHGMTLSAFPKPSAVLQSMNNNVDCSDKKQLHASYSHHLRIKDFNTTRGKVSTKVMLHMLKLPLMSERVSILQTQFLFRFLYLPEDALLVCYYLAFTTPEEASNTRSLKAAKRRFLQQNLEIRQRCRDSKLLSNCRRSISLDPILWLPMSKSERSRCIRWRLGWLPGGKPRPCPKHPTQLLSKKHAISCLDMHQRLFMPETIRDPLSFLLNILPLRPSVPQT